MDMNEYQQHVLRTAARNDDREKSRAVLAMGLAGEAGETVDMLKKHIGHGHALDLCKLKKELGDVLWYVAALAAEFGITLDDVAEANRLRKLFDDAGQGEHNVLALIDHYQRNSMDADDRLRAVRKLLEENGCECPCDHHPDERGDDCEVCLACRIGEAVGK